MLRLVYLFDWPSLLRGLLIETKFMLEKQECFPDHPEGISIEENSDCDLNLISLNQVNG